MSTKSDKLKSVSFSKVIVDEAAQAKELECVLGCLNAEQFVLVGDHK
jgi:superfamily I DNA and/or RNA helicase